MQKAFRGAFGQGFRGSLGSGGAALRFVVLDFDGNSFTVGSTVLNFAGSSFIVGSVVPDFDGNLFSPV